MSPPMTAGDGRSVRVALVHVLVHSVGSGVAVRRERQETIARDGPRRHARPRGHGRGARASLERTPLADDAVLADGRDDAAADRHDALALGDHVAFERLAALDAEPLAGLEAD